MTRARRTPLQRTRRKRRAAERDAPVPWDRSVTRLAGQPARRLCVVADSGAVPPWLTLESQALRATARTQAPTGIEPAASWPPLRGKREALNITAPSATLPQSLASSLGGSSAARPAGSQKGRLCLAPLRVGRGAGFARAAGQPACALALSRQRGSLARRCAQRWRNEPRPPRAVCCVRLRPCGPPFACSQPSLPSPCRAHLALACARSFRRRTACRAKPLLHPRKRGSPNFNGNPGPWGESSRRLPREPSAVLAASRPSPSGARAARP